MNKSFDSSHEKWTGLHGYLQDMLAGYADKELNDEQVRLVEAHLVGCEACQNDLARQQLMNQRFEAIMSSRMSVNGHNKIDKKLSIEAAAKNKPGSIVIKQLIIYLSVFRKQFFSLLMIASTGWALSLMLLVMLLVPALNQTEKEEIPMIHDALNLYYDLESKSLPVVKHNKETTPPINWPDSHLVSSWDTRVAGAPAKAYAIRSGHNIILQYHIGEAVFFRNPIVRQSIASSGNYKVSNNNIDILALPLTNSGVIVIGPQNSLPDPKKIIIDSI